LPKKRKALAHTPAPAASTQRPVIATRVAQELYDRIKAAASASGRSMGEELAWRVEHSFEWEKARGTIQGWLTEGRRVLEGNVEAAFRKRGFIPVALLPQGTAWLSPDADKERLNLAIDVKKVAHDMLPGLETALRGALGALAKTEDKK
jgi:hypothetical protein